MTKPSNGETRWLAYLGALAAELGHASRGAAMRAYCTGLLLPGGRKSVEPMAARITPTRAPALRQSMHHVVAAANWSDAAVLRAVSTRVLPAIERRGPVRHWVLDLIDFPKQGSRSVGVARQPGGRFGKPGNRQFAVSLSAAGDYASLPLAFQLSLPQDWADDPARCLQAGVPEEARSETRASLALGQVRRACEEGQPRGIVLGSAEFGDRPEVRAGLTSLDLPYVLGVGPSTPVQLPAAEGQAPGYGQASGPRAEFPAESPAGPVPALSLALSLPPRAWRRMAWREGGQPVPSSRFAALRVWPAASATEEWLLAEWPGGAAAPTGWWLSTLHPDTPLQDLVRAAKARWRTVRDLRELRQEAGFGHYEGRGWRGFHHHASLSIAAYGFLLAERCLFAPAQRFHPGRITPAPRRETFQPRGAAASAVREAPGGALGGGLGSSAVLGKP